MSGQEEDYQSDSDKSEISEVSDISEGSEILYDDDDQQQDQEQDDDEDQEEDQVQRFKEDLLTPSSSKVNIKSVQNYSRLILKDTLDDVVEQEEQEDEGVEIEEVEEEEVDQSSSISDQDKNDIIDIVQKKIKLEHEHQQKNLIDLEAKLDQEEKLEKLEQKHNWRNKARSKLEILNQIKLGTDQTITILPQSLTDDEQIMLSISKAQRYNNQLVDFRRNVKDMFRDNEQQRINQRSLLNTHENIFPSNQIPIILKNDSSTVILPPQNIFVRKGTIEQFIKINLDNEPALQQQEMQKKMGLNRIQRRKPYQKRQKPEV